MKPSFTQERFTSAVSSTTSIRSLLISLGLSPKGHNYKTAYKFIALYNLDTSHYTGKGWSKGKSFGPKTEITEYLNNTKPIASYHLKLKLLNLNMLSPICSNCKLQTWLNLPIPLELEHIDGNPYNNQLSNLCLLCPNCHALTPTYRGKNKKLKNMVPVVGLDPTIR